MSMWLSVPIASAASLRAASISSSVLMFLVFEILAKGERKCLKARIEKIDLKGAVSDLTLLSDELIETWLPDLAVAIGGGINAAIGSGRGTVQFHPKANGFTILRRTYYHVQVASMEPELNLTRRCLKQSALGAYDP